MKSLWRVLGLAALLAAGPRLAQGAAVTEAWVHRYDNVDPTVQASDVAFAVVCDAAGDVIVAGGAYHMPTTYPTTDMLTIKYSGTNGAVLWQRRGNSGMATAAAVDDSGNIVVTGTSWINGGYDMYTAKYAGADGALIWEQRYDGPTHNLDGGKAVAVDSHGDVVVTGRSYSLSSNDDYYTAKYAGVDGALVWERRYDDPGHRADQPSAIAIDPNDDVVVTGYSAGHNYDYYTAKYAGVDGTVLWENRYDGPALGFSNGDTGLAVAVDANGNVVVTGSSASTGASGGDYYTAMYAAADGSLLWEQRYNGPASFTDTAIATAVDGEGNVVVTGWSYPDLYSIDFCTAKYAAADGALLWQQRYHGPLISSQNQPLALAVDLGNNVVVTGSSTGVEGWPDYYTAKYAATDGTLLWEQRHHSLKNGAAKDVAVDGSGNVIVTGISNNGNDDDWYTAKYAAADGTLLWQQRYDSRMKTDNSAQAVAVDGAGDVVVTGSSQNGAPNWDRDYYTAKYSGTTGALLWEKRFSGLTNGNDEVAALALDAAGNVIVTGGSFNGTNSDYYTAKYAAADGALLWEQRHDGPAHGYDSAAALAVDSGGNAVVSGSSSNGVNLDFYTAKYSAANGALLWKRDYNGPANRDDRAVAVAVDGNANVAVTGSSGNGSGKLDYYTAKYAAADGALLWERRYSGAGSGDNVPAALVVDGTGSVIATGGSFNGTNSDYYTAKYAAVDGALLWERRYNGPANGNDSARAVAVDSSGSIVVTGTSHNGINLDFYTAKYAAANGALLWEKRYNGPADRDDQAVAVAVDSSGDVKVTGSSHNGANTDFVTLKYAAADGALLWEKRYDGPAGGDDSPNGSGSLALGPNGVVAVTGTSSGDYATVVYWEKLPPLTIVPALPGYVVVWFTGAPDHSYEVQRASAATGPWTTLATPTAQGNGVIEYFDTAPPMGTAFYRIRAQ